MEPFRAVLRAQDFDAFSEWDLQNGWDIEMMQLSTGKGQHEAKAVVFDDLLVFRVWSALRTLRTYCIPDGMVVFGFARAHVPGAWCGMAAPRMNLTIQWSGRTYWSLPPDDSMIYCFQLPASLVRQWGFLENQSVVRATIPEQACASAVSPIVGAFLDNVDAILEGRSQALDQFGTGKSGWLDHELIASGLQQVVDLCFHIDDADHAVHAFPKRALIDNARDLISGNLEEPLTAGHLAQVLGVSRRVLERSFQEILGMSPYQYVMIQKMHAVRKLLKSGSSSVLDACVANGFENAGRFAGKYANHFGELPSHTLRHGGRSPKTHSPPLVGA